jgi:mono/diheme cytochrome c family protein
MKNKFLSFGSLLVGSFVLLSMATIKSNQQDPWEIPSEYQNKKNPYAGLVDDEQIGKEIYGIYCQTCHGIKGKGDGINAKLIETPVADFTLVSFKNQTDGSIYYKAYTGRNEMPSFKTILPDEEDLWMVINYIKSL